MANKNLIRSYIARAGMTQNEVAEQAQMSKNTLSAKICGHIPFNTRDIRVLCEILDITDPVDKAAIFLD